MNYNDQITEVAAAAAMRCLQAWATQGSLRRERLAQAQCAVEDAQQALNAVATLLRAFDSSEDGEA